jgi:hypothetical protein
MANEQTGLLIIRAWVEPGSAEPLRAHIRVTDDVSAGIELTLTLSQTAAVGELVESWLEGMLGGAVTEEGAQASLDITSAS